jgi:hypothetical protein
VLLVDEGAPFERRGRLNRVLDRSPEDVSLLLNGTNFRVSTERDSPRPVPELLCDALSWPDEAKERVVRHGLRLDTRPSFDMDDEPEFVVVAVVPAVYSSGDHACVIGGVARDPRWIGRLRLKDGYEPRAHDSRVATREGAPLHLASRLRVCCFSTI